MGLVYTRASDSLLTTATISVNTGTEDTAYPRTNISDGHPEKPAKLTTTTGSWVADLGSAKAPELCAIFNHNFDAALDVRLQGNATNSWGAPSVNQTFTIPARYADKFTVNVWLDLKTLIPVAGNRTFQFWRLLVNSANSAAASVGEWRLDSTRRDLSVRNFKWGSSRVWRRPAIIHETELLVRRTYDLGTTIRTFACDIQPTDTILTDVDTWFRDANGVALPFVVVPRLTDTDALLVVFTNTDRPWTPVTMNYNTAKLEFVELSRGLFP